MYIPQAFREERPEWLQRVMTEYSFGCLVTTGAEGLMASHLPFLLEPGGESGVLVGHLARANPQWECFGAEALAIFQGPHGYISPSWYQNHPSVPTWDYAIVHAYGIPEVLDDAVRVRQVLCNLTDTFERALPKPWSIDTLDGDYIDRMVKGIVVFQMPIRRLEGKFKLSQNRPAADREGAIAGLRDTGRPEDSVLARWMAECVPGAV